MQHVQHTFFCLFSQLLNTAKGNIYFCSHCKQWQRGAPCKMKPADVFQAPYHQKKCTQKDPSGARFGAQKVACQKTYLEHDLERKKLHEKTPIWSTIWSTKSCTRKEPIWSTIWSTKSWKKKHSKNPLFWKIKLCSVQFWWESKIVGNTRDQFFKLSIANCVEWLQWARRAGTVKKKTLQTNHEAPE